MGRLLWLIVLSAITNNYLVTGSQPSVVLFKLLRFLLGIVFIYLLHGDENYFNEYCSSYPPNSKQMENSLNYLESRLSESEYLRLEFILKYVHLYIIKI